MTEFQAKIKFTFSRFLVLTFVTTTAVLFIRWLLAINLQLIEIDEDIWAIWISFGAAFIVYFVWLTPKLKLLKSSNSSRHRFYFTYVASVTCLGILFNGQNYLSTATGKLQQIKSVDEISSKPATRYYKVDGLSINIKGRRMYTVYTRKVAKINTDITFNKYIVIPIVSKELNASTRYWLGMKFYKHVNEKSSP